MPQDLLSRIHAYIRVHERGLIASHDLLWIECAADPRFVAHLDLLPAAVAKALKERAAKPVWAHPEDVVAWSGNSYAGVPSEAEEAAERHAYYWGARNLREYFFPDLPRPPFEIVASVGSVEYSKTIDHEIVAFGNFNTLIIRNNPLKLKRPDGSTKTTRALVAGRIRSESDPASSDYMVRRMGPIGVVLGPNVKSTDDVPPRTELFVDRSAVKRIAPPPSYL